MEKDIFKDFIPSILQSNKYQIENSEDEKSYNPFLVNKALSSHLDVIYHVYNMNLYPQLDKKMQYDYLFYGVRKCKRPFNKWLKSKETDDIAMLREYYGYSLKKAKEVLSLLSKEQLDFIREKTDLGGKSK